MKKAALCSLLLLGISAWSAHATDFTVTSPSVVGGKLTEKQVFNGFGCTGKNESPELKWSGAPAGTKSFAVTIYDPDAPTGSGWWHWVVYNIPANVTSLPGGAGADGGKLLPEGAAMGRTDYGSKAYGGACPPPGKPHRYVFTIHALKTEKIEVSEDASPALIGFNLTGNRIEKAVLTTTYGH